MLNYGKELRQGSAWGRILAVSLLVFSSAQILASRDQDFTLRIPPVRTTLNVENQPVNITASGSITMTGRQRDQVAFRLELVADLSDFQQNITGVLRSELDKSERCGERIEIQHATLAPADPASVVTAQLHYERWACAKMFGKQTAHRLVGGNAVVELKLTPVVEDYRTVRLQPELGTIQADGSLGELLRDGAGRADAAREDQPRLALRHGKGHELQRDAPAGGPGASPRSGVRGSRMPATAASPWFWTERSTSLPSRHNSSKTNCKTVPCGHNNFRSARRPCGEFANN